VSDEFDAVLAAVGPRLREWCRRSGTTLTARSETERTRHPGTHSAFAPERGMGVALANHMIESRWPAKRRRCAAASNSAKVARIHGGFSTSSTAPIMQAQVQVVGVHDPEAGLVRADHAEKNLAELRAKA
jgi:hypothetical protein